MGRGGGQDVLKQQRAKENAAVDVAAKQAGETFGTVTAADKATIDQPMSEAEKTARTQGVLQPLAESFDASAQAAGNLAGKTRNFSGYQENLGKQAQQRAQKTAQANQALTADIGNTEFARRQAALGREAGMFGTATGAETGRLGTAGQTTGELAQLQARPGFWDQMGTSFASGLGSSFGGGFGGRLFGSPKKPGAPA